MDKQTLIAAKVPEAYRDEAHKAAKSLGTTVAAIIRAAMDKAIKKAGKVSQ